MVLIEEIEAAGKSCRLQVFASDVDTEALETARAGVYPEGIAAHVSAERLSRFFIKGEHSYRSTRSCATRSSLRNRAWSATRRSPGST